MLHLNQEDVRQLLMIKSADIAPILEQRLVQSARETIASFFTDPSYGSLVNVGTLQTDARVIITRRDTLHALLRAATHGTTQSYRKAGYEAGSLYGVGVVGWFLSRSAEVRGMKGLPRDSYLLLQACAEIDKASGLGNIEVQHEANSEMGAIHGWKGTVLVRDDFLVHEHEESGARPAHNRRECYGAFWQGYLEGTFSSSLAAWYGLWTKEGAVMPLFVAQCDEVGPRGVRDVLDISFVLEVHPPLYLNTVNTLQRDILCPYLRQEFGTAVMSARPVVDGLVREISGFTGKEETGTISKVLEHLGKDKDLPPAMRSAIAALQNVRPILNEPHHDSREPSSCEARYIVRTVASALLMASRDIRLTDRAKQDARAILTGMRTPPRFE